MEPKITTFPDFCRADRGAGCFCTSDPRFASKHRPNLYCPSGRPNRTSDQCARLCHCGVETQLAQGREGTAEEGEGRSDSDWESVRTLADVLESSWVS